MIQSSELQQALEALAQPLLKPLGKPKWLPVAPKVDGLEVGVDKVSGRDWIRFTRLGRPFRAGSVTHRLLGAVAEVAPRLDCTKCGKPISSKDLEIYRTRVPTAKRPAYCCMCFWDLLQTMDTEENKANG